MEITIWDEFPNSGLQLCYLPFYNYVTDLAFRAPGGGGSAWQRKCPGTIVSKRLKTRFFYESQQSHEHPKVRLSL